MNYFLMRAPAGAHTLAELEAGGPVLWTGVRVSAERDLMTRRMAISDRVLHVQALPEAAGGAVVDGLMRVAASARPDPTQFDQADAGFDGAATRERPLWYCVPVELLARAPSPLTLEQLRAEPTLAGLELLAPGPTPSIQRVEPGHFRILLRLTGMRQRPPRPGPAP